MDCEQQAGGTRRWFSESYKLENMHQTFYIDGEEEITSIVERLRNAKPTEVVFVVPKRALLLQSIINLRILRSEAQKRRKKILIVTQDEEGLASSQRAGIASQASLDGLEDDAEVREELLPHLAQAEKDSFAKSTNNFQNTIGSQKFYDKEEGGLSVSPQRVPSRLQGQLQAQNRKKGLIAKESLLNKELITGETLRHSNIKTVSLTVPRSGLMPLPSEKHSTMASQRSTSSAEREEERERSIQKYFFGKRKKKSLPGKTPRVSHSSRRRLFGLGIGSLLIIIIGAIFATLPKTTVRIVLRTEQVQAGVNIIATTNAQRTATDTQRVPARIFVDTIERTEEYSATGKSASSDQKAHGTVVIYNDYSTESQPLVATTRLLTKDGRIFRLINSVIVPGRTGSGADVKQGAIEVEVIADESGDQFNIGPSEFTIPGFSGSAKYEKFTAKSTKAMTGGGAQGETITTISDVDLANAERNIKEKISADAVQRVKEELLQGEVLLDDAVEVHATVTTTAQSGVARETFSVNAIAQVRAFIFAQNDVRDLVEKALQAENENHLDMNRERIDLSYGTARMDFDAQEMQINVEGKAVLVPHLSKEDIHRDLRGKGQEKIREALGRYPQIDHVEFVFSPSFLPERVPYVDAMVSIEMTQDRE